ncbi:MAG: DNA-directed RNA polymerase subunit beta [Tenericutes bacterium]|nr:DNA-directed RNA polymerase subunit beta [Mycoplasmatota bacterium]
MAYKTVKFGDHRERRSFSTKRSTLELSNLLEVQKDSFDLFLKEGIKEVFEDIFPVESFSGSLSLEFGDYYFDEPKYSVKESRERKVTYAAPLKVKARLFINETGEVKEQEVFLGDMPLMTDTASFIINGAERVINSQLVMGPSCYYKNEVDKSGRNIISSEVRPNKGTWLEYELDARGILYVRIDRTRKVPVTTLLRALGLSSDDEILNLFGQDEYLINTLEKDSTKNTDEALIEIYEKLRPGEPATLDSAKNQLIVRFFDKFRYDLGKVGRYKFNKKLNVIDRLLNVKIAQDIVVDGEVKVKKGTKITKELLEELKSVFEAGYGVKEVTINEELDTYNKIQEILVYSPEDETKIVKVIGNDQTIDTKRLTISDVYASLSYYICLLYGIGKFDEIDHLGNRRVRQVGELIQNQFRIGVARMERQIRDKMSTQEIDAVTPKSLINIRPITAALKEFFGSSQLSKFMEQINPLSELNDKRRLSALGPGGLSRDRAGMEVRDVNPSHYGRICPIETPEGQNIGLITSLASYAKINEYGFIMTPYRKVVDCKVTDEIVYMTADEEEDYYISQATIDVDKDGYITDATVPVRFNRDNMIVAKEKVNYIDVSPSQIVSVTTSMIPFMEHDDANRTLMGANMQRQAVPLMITEAPIVGTGVEAAIARDSGCSVVSDIDGVVEYVDAKKIIVKGATEKHTYELISYQRSNNETCYNQRPIVHKGEQVHKGEIIADGPSTDMGEIGLGKNLVVAFMTYNGYNYEDAVILNERIVRDDVLTSVHIEMKEIECRDTKLGPEEFTRDIPNISEDARKNLDENGIVRIGTEVKENDILVGKVTPKGMQELSSEEKLLHAIFGEKTREVRDTSLRVSHGCAGIVHDVQIFTKENSDELPAGVSKVVRVYIVKKRKIQVGDKMAGRHGNKGVCSLILPSEDMPYLPDGTPVDVILNPLGVPSRMNLGQILELHLGMAGKKLGVHYATPIFDSATEKDIQEEVAEAGLDPDYKTWLYDGKTGEKFDKRVSVGVMYMIRLVHMVDDKIHARATGPYSMVTQQPLGGKAQFGGQRFGEMEVWALYAYGAAHILQEVLTIKSDDVVGRVRVYEALVKGKPIPQPGVPESFRVLIKEFQALGLDIQIVNKDGTLKEIKDLESEEDKDDAPVSIEEIGKHEEETPESDYEDVEKDEEEDDFDDVEPTDEDLEYEEEYGLDNYQDDAYERGEE